MSRLYPPHLSMFMQAVAAKFPRFRVLVIERTGSAPSQDPPPPTCPQEYDEDWEWSAQELANMDAVEQEARYQGMEDLIDDDGCLLGHDN